MAFGIGFIALGSVFGPLMVSLTALTMGRIDLLGQDPVAAKEHLNLAIQADPHSSTAYQTRGLLYGQLQQADKAIADLTKSIELGGGSDAYFARAFQYHVCGKLDQALKDYKMSLKKGRAKKSDVWVNEADVLYRLNRADEAISLCDQAIDESPRLQIALLNRAQAYIKQGRYQAALDDLNTDIDGTIPQPVSTDMRRDCLWMRAVAYRGLRNTSAADADLLEARKAARYRHLLAQNAIAAESEFAQKTQRKYFILCNLKCSKPENEEQADQLQALLKFINANLVHVWSNKHLHIFSFPDSKQYDTYMSGKKRLQEGPFDIDKNAAAMKVWGAHYDLNTNSILSYPSPGMNGVLYAVVQKVLMDTPFTDKWAPQGIAMLLMKSYGYNSTTDCQLLLSENLRNYPLRGGKIPTLVEVINNSRAKPDDAAPMFAALYLLKKGKLHTYLDLCRSGNIGSYSSLFEAAMGKNAPALEPDWKSFIADIQKEQTSSPELPATQILSSKEKFDEFSKKNPQLQLSALKGNPVQNEKNDGAEKIYFRRR